MVSERHGWLPLDDQFLSFTCIFPCHIHRVKMNVTIHPANVTFLKKHSLNLAFLSLPYLLLYSSVSKLPICLCFFSVLGTEYLDETNIRDKRLTSPHSSRVQSLIVGKSEWQELEGCVWQVTSQPQPGTKVEKGLCYMGPFAYLHNAGSQAGMVSPKVCGQSGMPRNPFLHGSRFCKVDNSNYYTVYVRGYVEDNPLK